MSEEITDQDIEEVKAQTLVTGQSYSRPGFQKNNVALKELDRVLDKRRARRRARLGATSVGNFS